MASKFNVLALGVFIIALGMFAINFSLENGSSVNFWIIGIPMILLGILILFFITPIKNFFNSWSSH